MKWLNLICWVWGGTRSFNEVRQRLWGASGLRLQLNLEDPAVYEARVENCCYIRLIYDYEEEVQRIW